ncbi:selenocysteine lyase-like [Corticium candelabrum]|uniref:selenocysteine lyase-like n=1 Tax=Corticium candelabrum TaxID=121492 RepID=UPI002E263049|nr:selenocysteine lyase-like [Corticium candelabrum]
MTNMSRAVQGDVREIYLDYNATTPLAPEVLESIYDALANSWGNPSSSHHQGVKAKSVISTARHWIAKMVGGKDEDIVITSGGTESNALVFNSCIEHYRRLYPKSDQLPHIVTSNLEHDSVMLTVEEMRANGKIELTVVTASHGSGKVSPTSVVSALRPNTIGISIMYANNETGVIQPLQEISHVVKTWSKANCSHQILVHTDAAQAIGKIPVNVNTLSVDYLTIVGHKFYGPRIGALYARQPAKVTPVYPMLFGGGQERNFRPGTENTGMIAGLGKAAELVCKHISDYHEHMKTVRDYLEQQLELAFPGHVTFNGQYAESERIPNTCNVSFKGYNLKGYRIMKRLKWTLASIGSACHSEDLDKPSPILLAIGIPDDLAGNALRLSIGRETSKQDIDIVIADLRAAIATLTDEQDKQ